MRDKTAIQYAQSMRKLKVITANIDLAREATSPSEALSYLGKARKEMENYEGANTTQLNLAISDLEKAIVRDC
jgi:hypothetical protein